MAGTHILKTVYFVRHGQTEDNASEVVQIHNSSLSALGQRQAESVAGRVAKLQFEALISSPSNRTKETALAITKVTGKEPEFFELFKERAKPSSIHGKLHADPAALATRKEWEKSLWTPGVRVEDGENFDDLAARSAEALAFLEARPEQALVVVTHDYFMRTLVARVLLGAQFSPSAFGEFQEAINLENTGITVLRSVAPSDAAPRWKLWVFNDHAHLG